MSQPHSESNTSAAPERDAVDSFIDVGLVFASLALGVMLLSGLGRHEPKAWADMAVRSNDHAMVTTKSGTDEVLAVIDDRAEMLLIYEVINQNQLRLSARESLPNIFNAARNQRPAR